MELMDDFIQWFNYNKWLNFIFLLLTIFSIIVSIYLYYKSKRKKIPLYAKRSVNIISDKVQNVANVDVSYLGEKINNLTLTKIAIWNQGNETIEFSDLASSDKLRIETTENITLFNAEVIFQSKNINNIKTKIENNIVFIDFDYFDQKQGGIIKLIHSGKKSSEIKVSGTFKGVGEIKKLNLSLFDVFIITLLSSFKVLGKNPKRGSYSTLIKIIPWSLIIVGLGLMIGFVFSIDAKLSDRLFLAIMGFTYFMLGIVNLFSTNPLPKNFEVFYDDE